MPRQVFVSHSSADAAAADAIRAALESRGISCWIAPRDITPGLEWADAIMLGIAESRLLLLVHSEAVSASPMVRREVNAALTHKLPVLTVRIDAALPRDGMEFYLGASHWFDAQAGVQFTAKHIAAAAENLLATTQAATSAGAEPAFEDRPAIAVLPFRGYGNEDRFAEQLTDELITALSAWRVFPVIARDSVFAVKREDVDARVLGRLLGARYIVSGGIRQTLSGLRVTAELIDVASGAVLLAETIERAAGDPLGILDDVVAAAATALTPEVWRREQSRAVTRGTANPTAYDLVQQGLWHRQKQTAEDLAQAEALFRQALAVEPHYVRALTSLSICRNYAAIRRWTKDVPAAFREAMDYARQAMATDRNDPQCHYVLGVAHMNLGHRDEAVNAFRDTIRLNPSHTNARANLAQVFNYLDQPGPALTELDVALRLTRHSPFRFQWLPYAAASHYLSGRYRECLVAAQQSLEANPDYPLAIRYAAAALGQLGLAAQAKPMLGIMRRVDGSFANLETMTRRLFVSTAADRLLDGFHKAGFA